MAPILEIVLSILSLLPVALGTLASIVTIMYMIPKLVRKSGENHQRRGKQVSASGIRLAKGSQTVCKDDYREASHLGLWILVTVISLPLSFFMARWFGSLVPSIVLIILICRFMR